MNFACEQVWCACSSLWALQMKLKSEHEDIFSHSFPIPNYNEPALALWFSLEQLEARGLYESGERRGIIIL